MPLAIGEPSTWLIMIRRFGSACSMEKIAPLGSRLIEIPALLVICTRPRSSRRGVVRISVDELDIPSPMNGSISQRTPIVSLSNS